MISTEQIKILNKSILKGENLVSIQVYEKIGWRSHIICFTKSFCENFHFQKEKNNNRHFKSILFFFLLLL